MQADWSDAPEYIRVTPRKRNIKNWISSAVLGTCVTLGLLHVAGPLLLHETGHNPAKQKTQSKQGPVAEITAVQSAASNHWEHVVEAQARRDRQTIGNATPSSQTEAANAQMKQTAFDAGNYRPRAADNVVSFNEPPKPMQTPKPAEMMRVTIVGQKPSMKDQACWPHKEGSIARRNCRTSIGLNYRD